MRFHPLLSPALLGAAVLLAAGTGAHAADLKLVIAGAGGPGQVYAKLFADAASFDRRDAAVASMILTPTSGQVIVTLGNLAPGRYALAAFQDAKGTGKLESNLLGMPQVPYGFSNDASGTMGPPSFDRAAFSVGADGAAITFTLR